MSAMGIALACGGWLLGGIAASVVPGWRIRMADSLAGHLSALLNGGPLA